MERKYYSKTFKADSGKKIQDEMRNLKDLEIKSNEELISLIERYSELSAIVEETMAWKYIDMTRYANDSKYSDDFNEYYRDVVAIFTKKSIDINNKIYNSKFLEKLPKERYENYIKVLKNEIEMFEEKNIELSVQESELSNKYGETMSKVVVEFQGEKHTLLGMKKFLEDNDRNIREKAFKKRYEALKGVNSELNELFDKLLKLRVEMAKNKGFSNYRDYMHRLKGRFSYTPEDLYKFHEAVEEKVVPLLKKLNDEKAKKLELDRLRPWDTSVSIDGKKLQPFEDVEEFISKGIEVLSKVDKKFSENLEYMKDNGFLDLGNREGKAPGGYNYPLYESGVPFIFMNAIGVHSDVITLMHESGHAMHSFATNKEKIITYQETPSEVAELASMSMEFMSTEGWEIYYPEVDDYKKAIKDQIMRSIETLPWVMIIDAYQHYLYLNPDNTREDREAKFRELMDRFNPGIDWTDLDVEKGIAWINQLHIFEVPFYYIEYAISQLGAIGIYRNYKVDKNKTLNEYKNFLSLGYSKSIEDIYKTAGLKFNFSVEYIGELMEFLESELKNYK